MEKETVNKTSLSMSIFYKDVRKFDPFSGDKQIELAIKARNGDQKSQDDLVKSNQRFLIATAKEYQNLGIPLDDLVNEGNLGLIKAIFRYDETKGVKFLSYAVWWIRQAMLQSIYESGETVRLPVNRINAINKLSKVKDKLVQVLDREPTLEEICEMSDMEEGDVRSTYISNQSVSLDAKVSEDSEGTMIDFLENENHNEIETRLNKESLIKEINSIFKGFSLREVDIMNMYYGLNGHESMTLKEIGEELSLTNERVRQIKESVNRKMRSHSKSSKLREFLNVKLN